MGDAEAVVNPRKSASEPVVVSEPISVDWNPGDRSRFTGGRAD